MNKLVLDGVVASIEPLRYTPAGIPLLSFVVQHVSDQIEGGMKRKVECVLNAVALGNITSDTALKAVKIGDQVEVTGFLAKRSLKSTQLVMHINAISLKNSEQKLGVYNG